MTKVGVYIRVSTEEQAKEGFSIEAQKNRLLAFIKSQDWDLYDVYTDEGISAKAGSLENRKELQRMIGDVKAEKIDVVLVIRLDRLTRSVVDLYKLLEIFEEHQCAFRSATEVYDTTTPTGKLFITIVAAMAQWERETIAERIKEGMEQMVREKKWHGGTAPYGFDKEMKVVEEEAHVIRMMFQVYNEGELGEDSLAHWLNDNGFTKNGDEWQYSNINYILQNPIYIGHFRWNHKKKDVESLIIENAVPAILDKETFDKAQEIRKLRKSVHPRAATSNYIFSGRAKCARCGGPLKGQGGQKGPSLYYVCTNKRTRKCTQMKYFREDVMEKELFKLLEVEYVNLTVASLVATSHKLDERKKTLAPDISLLEKKLKKIKKRRANWIRALGDGDITQAEYREHTSADRIEEEKLNQKLTELKNEPLSKKSVIKRSPSELVAIITTLKHSWSKASSSEKKQLIQKIFTSITVDMDEKGHISGEIEYA